MAEPPRKKLCCLGEARPGVSHATANDGDQGRFGKKCVAYPFSVALAEGLLEKYGVTCSAEHIVEKIKTLCPCWDSHVLDRVAEEWNAEHAEPQASIESTEKAWRYNVRVDLKKISTFAEANDAMERAEKLSMYMPCIIAKSAREDDLCAVALAKRVSSEMMEARSSWGSERAFLDVWCDNFKEAITFDPVITAVVAMDGDSWTRHAIPPERKTYRQRLEEFEKERRTKIQCIIASLGEKDVASILHEMEKYAIHSGVQQGSCRALWKLAYDDADASRS
jgi:hypothetical protein